MTRSVQIQQFLIPIFWLGSRRKSAALYGFSPDCNLNQRMQIAA